MQDDATGDDGVDGEDTGRIKSQLNYRLLYSVFKRQLRFSLPGKFILRPSEAIRVHCQDNLFKEVLGLILRQDKLGQREKKG